LAGQEKDIAKKLNKAYSKIEKESFEEEVLVDRQFAVDEVSWDSYYQIEALGPYGMHNPKPIFLLKDAVIDSVKTFGNGGIHLELVFKKSSGTKVSAIGFFTCSSSEKFDALNGHIFKGVNLEAGQKIDALVNLEKSMFKNYPELRLRIVDIRGAN
jgi:single-stranded DNA-specific DHH superfamily exonuclease